MSYITQAEKGLKAAQVGNHEEAITNLNLALKHSPNPAWLLARSRSLIATSHYAEALADAEAAFHSAYARNSRPMMQEAQYRRAVAHLRLSQPANAAACCVFAIRLTKGKPATEKGDVLEGAAVVDERGFWKQSLEEVKREVDEDPWSQVAASEAMAGAATNANDGTKRAWKMACVLRHQAVRQMEDLPVNDEKRRVTVSQKPEHRELVDIDVKGSSSNDKAAAAAPDASTIPPKPVADTPPRMDDYQTTTHMNVSIFSKGNIKDDLKVDFSATHVIIDPLVHPNGSKKPFRLDLWDEIEPEGSKYSVTPSKVELTLRKKKTGKWNKLRGESKKEGKVPTEAPETEAAAASSPPPPSTAAEAPSQAKSNTNTTSSTAGLSKWYNKDVDLDGAEDEDGSDVNAFFKKLYKSATPEQQRAMIKSFTESSGTSLSTDWDDVKARHVAPAPPDGAVAKEWEK